MSKNLVTTGRAEALMTIGKSVSHLNSVEDVMKEIGAFNRNIHKSPLQTTILTDTGVKTIDVPSQHAIVGTNYTTGTSEVYGVAGDRYTVVPDEVVASMADYLKSNEGLDIPLAGMLDDGRKMFIAIRTSEIQIAGDDHVSYLVIRNSYDGSGAFQAYSTLTRLACDNQLAATFKGSQNSHTFRHTTNVLTRIGEAVEALKESREYIGTFAEKLTALANVPMRQSDFTNFMHRLYGVKNGEASTRKQGQLDTIQTLWTESPTIQDTAGTRLGAYQAVTEYLGHYAEAHGKGDVQAYNRAQRDLFDDRIRSRAYELLAV